MGGQIDERADGAINRSIDTGVKVSWYKGR